MGCHMNQMKKSVTMLLVMSLSIVDIQAMTRGADLGGAAGSGSAQAATTAIGVVGGAAVYYAGSAFYGYVTGSSSATSGKQKRGPNPDTSTKLNDQDAQSSRADERRPAAGSGNRQRRPGAIGSGLGLHADPLWLSQYPYHHSLGRLPLASTDYADDGASVGNSRLPHGSNATASTAANAGAAGANGRLRPLAVYVASPTDRHTLGRRHEDEVVTGVGAPFGRGSRPTAGAAQPSLQASTFAGAMADRSAGAAAANGSGSDEDAEQPLTPKSKRLLVLEGVVGTLQAEVALLRSQKVHPATTRSATHKRSLSGSALGAAALARVVSGKDEPASPRTQEVNALRKGFANLQQQHGALDTRVTTAYEKAYQAHAAATRLDERVTAVHGRADAAHTLASQAHGVASAAQAAQAAVQQQFASQHSELQRRVGTVESKANDAHAAATSVQHELRTVTQQAAELISQSAAPGKASANAGDADGSNALKIREGDPTGASSIQRALQARLVIVESTVGGFTRKVDDLTSAQSTLSQRQDQLQQQVATHVSDVTSQLTAQARANTDHHAAVGAQITDVRSLHTARFDGINATVAQQGRRLDAGELVVGQLSKQQAAHGSTIADHTGRLNQIDTTVERIAGTSADAARDARIAKDTAIEADRQLNVHMSSLRSTVDSADGNAGVALQKATTAVQAVDRADKKAEGAVAAVAALRREVPQIAQDAARRLLEEQSQRLRPNSNGGRGGSRDDSSLGVHSRKTSGEGAAVIVAPVITTGGGVRDTHAVRANNATSQPEHGRIGAANSTTTAAQPAGVNRHIRKVSSAVSAASDALGNAVHANASRNLHAAAGAWSSGATTGVLSPKAGSPVSASSTNADSATITPLQLPPSTADGVMHANGSAAGGAAPALATAVIAVSPQTGVRHMTVSSAGAATGTTVPVLMQAPASPTPKKSDDGAGRSFGGARVISPALSAMPTPATGPAVQPVDGSGLLLEPSVLRAPAPQSAATESDMLPASALFRGQHQQPTDSVIGNSTMLSASQARYATAAGAAAAAVASRSPKTPRSPNHRLTVATGKNGRNTSSHVAASTSSTRTTVEAGHTEESPMSEEVGEDGAALTLDRANSQNSGAHSSGGGTAERGSNGGTATSATFAANAGNAASAGDSIVLTGDTGTSSRNAGGAGQRSPSTYSGRGDGDVSPLPAPSIGGRDRAPSSAASSMNASTMVAAARAAGAFNRQDDSPSAGAASPVPTVSRRGAANSNGDSLTEVGAAAALTAAAGTASPASASGATPTEINAGGATALARTH